MFFLLSIGLLIATIALSSKLAGTKRALKELLQKYDAFERRSLETADATAQYIASLKSENDRTLYELNAEKKENEKYKPLIQEFKNLEEVQRKTTDANSELSRINEELNSLSAKLDVTVRYKELSESGFYTYRFKFEETLQYREALHVVREARKLLISSKKAVTCSVKALRDSILVKNLTKIVLLALNNEYELLAARLTATNFENCTKKLSDHFDDLNELISPFNCTISRQYLESLVKELAVGLEYEMEMQRIRDEQSALKEQLRDEQKAREEAEAAREKALEEERKYEELLVIAKKEVQSAAAEMQDEMLARIADLEAQVAAAREERIRKTAMAQLTKRGHVYIISNIGSFGDDVFKIGVTRREDPMERVAELSNASVPFAFDVHAVIRSDDAPALEAALHQRFDSHRINKVNTRKEFFRVSLSQIADTCKDLGCEVTLTQMAEARDYRQSLEISKSVS